IRLGSAPRVRTSTWSVGTTGVGLSRETEISDEDLEITLALSQVIELGGKRARRLELAARDRDVFAWDYEIARANVLRDVAQAYVS
ncbi:TolC family protein, partial [Pseudomonas sp. Kh14]|uniref:TolC family protein n=1 Tax=Pseudomonas sp. Kh14 TaxID=2093745 RepID=UPI0015B6F112